MREFILRARHAKTNSDINFNELPREGKLDSVCATIASALFVSGDVRRDTTIHAVLEGPSNAPKTITFTGAEIRGLRHDERSIASYIAAALQKGAFLQLNEEAHVRTGIRVAKKSFERLVYERAQKYKQVLLLDVNGKDLRSVALEKDFLVVMGGAEGLPPKTERTLVAQKISLGPKMLFAAHCPVIVHNEADRR